MKLSLTTEAGQNIAVRVSPLQGCVLMLFGRHNRWSLQQLCKELSLESESLKRKILPLINQGLLQELEGGVYQFVERLESNMVQEELIIEEETVPEEERSEQASPNDIFGKNP
jgi:hypothetical protein